MENKYLLSGAKYSLFQNDKIQRYKSLNRVINDEKLKNNSNSSGSFTIPVLSRRAKNSHSKLAPIVHQITNMNLLDHNF